jgi:transaldolase
LRIEHEKKREVITMIDPQSVSPSIHLRRVRLPETKTTPKGKRLAWPAPHAPLIFADTAKLDEIMPLYEAGIVHGVTTNPTLLKRAGAKSWGEAKEIMKALCDALKPNPVSLELTELEPSAMIRQAEELHALGENSVIKVPIGGFRAIDPALDPYTGLKVIHALWERDIMVNCTLIFNSTQAVWAAMAGAAYVSPFLGRLADYRYKRDHPERIAGNALYWIEDPKNEQEGQMTFNSEYVASGGARKDAGARLIHEIAAIFANYDFQTLVLAASFRNPVQITECLLAGADILTVPAGILQTVADHPLSDAGMKSFIEDSKVFTR